MSDLISRQAVIKLIHESADDFSKLVYGMVDPYDLAFKVGHLPSAEPEQQWTSVKERLPEYGQAVLVALDGGSMTDGVRSADHAGRSVWDCALDNRTWYGDENIVTAWMPLPEPWRAENE